jgi:hypothetical protein
MYAAFPIAIFFIGAAILVGLPLASTLQTYFKNRGRRPVVCPDDDQCAQVVVDNKFVLQAAMRGKEQMRVKSCTHWPQNEQCGQECLVQVDATSENIDRLLTRWLGGKSCNACGRLLTPADWRFGRLGFFNEQFKLVELRQIDLDEIGSVPEPTRPLCWSCHQQEKQRQTQPVHIGFQTSKA